jgi:hypothetical protein
VNNYIGSNDEDLVCSNATVNWNLHASNYWNLPVASATVAGVTKYATVIDNTAFSAVTPNLVFGVKEAALWSSNEISPLWSCSRFSCNTSVWSSNHTNGSGRDSTYASNNINPLWQCAEYGSNEANAARTAARSAQETADTALEDAATAQAAAEAAQGTATTALGIADGAAADLIVLNGEVWVVSGVATGAAAAAAGAAATAGAALYNASSAQTTANYGSNLANSAETMATWGCNLSVGVSNDVYTNVNPAALYGSNNVNYGIYAWAALPGIDASNNLFSSQINAHSNILWPLSNQVQAVQLTAWSASNTGAENAVDIGTLFADMTVVEDIAVWSSNAVATGGGGGGTEAIFASNLSVTNSNELYPATDYGVYAWSALPGITTSNTLFASQIDAHSNILWPLSNQVHDVQLISWSASNTGAANAADIGTLFAELIVADSMAEFGSNLSSWCSNTIAATGVVSDGTFGCNLAIANSNELYPEAAYGVYAYAALAGITTSNTLFASELDMQSNLLWPASSAAFMSSNTSVSASNTANTAYTVAYSASNTGAANAADIGTLFADMIVTGSMAEFGSNLAVSNSNALYPQSLSVSSLSNQVYTTLTPSTTTASATAVFSSNLSIWNSNALSNAGGGTGSSAYWQTSNALMYSMSNCSIGTACNQGYSLQAYGAIANTGIVIGRSGGATVQVSPSGLSQGQLDWASNTSIIASNNSFFASNSAASSVVVSGAAASAAAYSSNTVGTTTSTAIFSSNTSIAASNAVATVGAKFQYFTGGSNPWLNLTNLNDVWSNVCQGFTPAYSNWSITGFTGTGALTSTCTSWYRITMGAAGYSANGTSLIAFSAFTGTAPTIINSFNKTSCIAYIPAGCNIQPNSVVKNTVANLTQVCAMGVDLVIEKM